ncbi:hypothetical protein BGZ47_001782 [Haplosporangium gracile]|nr:hypothetical protein BGZ47_001782 [Haplosporangium gracile]
MPKTTPIQEPYFQTRHTIASQHTLSTLGGILFSLDEVPSEFNQDMYIAMRNRIFELEAKSVNYSPFSHSRKRSFERNGLDDYPDRYAYGYDIDTGHYSKRPAHRYLPYGPPDQGPPPTHHRQSTSHPSWYTPEVYSSRPRYPPHHGRPPSDRERDHRHPGGGPYYDQDNGPGSLSGSRPGSPGLNHNNSALPPMRSAYSPPPASELSRQQPQSGQLPHSSHPHQAGPPPQDQRQQQQHLNSERPSGNMTHNGPYPPNSHPHPPPHHQSDHHPSTHPSHHPQHPHPHGPPHHHPLGPPQHQPPLQGYQQQQLQPIQPNGPTGAGHSQSMGAVTPEQRQSIHQQRHRAQQQAQSAHSRSYHLHKHMRLLDQQRAAQMAVQQQQHQQHAHEQQQQQQKYQQQKQQQGQSFKPIQRQYQPHQQMYPSYNQPIAIKPHPGPTQTQQQQLQKQQAQAQAQAQTTNIRPNPFQQQQQRLTPQQQMMQRYQQQRQLQQKQQQLRQLQYLRNRPAATYSTQKITATTTPSSALTGGSPGSHSPTPPRVFGPQVDRPIKKSTRPLECSNCMALDSLAWKPKVELQIVTPNGSNPSGESATAAAEGEVAQGAKLLCPACTQYLQTHGKARPVPPFRTNYLKKIHTRFKRELQEVRFQGWQDAQVLEIEDRMVEREFQMVFNGLDESDACQTQSRSNSVAASPAPAVPTASALAPTEPASTGSATDKDSAASTSFSSGAKEAAVAVSPSKIPERIVIKVEDDGEETVGSLKKSKLESVEVRTFQSEASVGELFGHRWRTEPVVGYTLVHFGGSDRTRMVPMNPTVPFLTVKFDRTTESITFAFRVLVNGLCLLSSGGGPPALHMPEMADDDESEEEEEIVVVPDNDKDDETSSPSASSPTEPVRSKRDVAPEGAATASMTTNNSNNNTATSESSSTSTSATAMEVDAAPK